MQNKLYYTTAVSAIENMTEEEVKNKIKELKKIGYDYNENLEIVIEEDITIPYDFILFCLLIEKEQKMPSVETSIINVNGLHMRPAGKIVDEASKFKSDIYFHIGEISVAFFVQ